MMEEGGNKTPLVLTGEAEVAAGGAMGGGDDVEQQNMEEGVEVLGYIWAHFTSFD